MFQKFPENSDPNEPMAGTCATCKSRIECRRSDTVLGGEWKEPSVECPRCKELSRSKDPSGCRVFVHPLNAIEALALMREDVGVLRRRIEELTNVVAEKDRIIALLSNANKSNSAESQTFGRSEPGNSSGNASIGVLSRIEQALKDEQELLLTPEEATELAMLEVIELPPVPDREIEEA